MKSYSWPLLACLFAASCATRSEQYHWGEYENMIHSTFGSTEGSEPLEQVQKLSAHIQEAESKGLKVPPGLYAHLGYMKHLVGDHAGAVAALATEKELYPSSKVFVDRLLASLSGQKPKQVDVGR